MKNHKLIFLRLLPLLFFLYSSAVFAESPVYDNTEQGNAESGKKEKKLPKSGSLSNSISGISASRNVPDTWGGTDVKGEDSAPITGSVSKVTQTKWVARVFNNSKETYSANFSVSQFNRNGTKVKSDSFSATLKPGEKIERDVTALNTTEQCSLDLVNWSKRGGAKTEK